MKRFAFALLLSALVSDAAADSPLVGGAPSTLSPELARASKSGPKDQRLPAGFQGVVWGANEWSIPALRGRALERQTTADSAVIILIEAPIPGEEATEDVGVVKYRLWRGQLVSVTQYLPGELTMKEGRELVVRFEQRYGKGEHKVDYIKARTASGDARDKEHLERWLWKDDFTLQVLTRDVESNQWTIERRSVLLEASQAVQEQQDRDAVRSSRVQNLSIE